MPVYTYRCGSCGVQFERQQSFNDPTLRVCPECRQRSLKRVISPVRIVFKGSGFYSTDHRPSSASSSPSTSKNEGTKTDTKAAKPAKESTAADKTDASD